MDPIEKITSKEIEDYILKSRESFESIPQAEKSDKASEVLFKAALPLLDHVIRAKLSRDEGDIRHKLMHSLSEYISTIVKHVDGHHLESFYDEVFKFFEEKELIVFLHHLLQNVTIVDHKYMLTKLFQLLKHFDITFCYHASSLVLPYLVVDHQTGRLMWSFVASIWLQENAVESQSVDLVLTLICCLVHVFVNPSLSLVSRPSSANIQSLPDPVYDVRPSKMFWDIIQFGLVDTNPLSRKRSLFLLDRVLKSVSEGGIESDDCVFWWGCHGDGAAGGEWPEKEMKEIWEDVILLLETLEEKQVFRDMS